MPRKNASKGNRKGGRPTGSPRWNPQSSRLNPSVGFYNPSSPFAQSSASTTPRGHTLAEEARATSKRPRGFFGQDAKLRHRPVIFVKGGFMDPMKELNIPQKEASADDKRDEASVEEHVMPPASVGLAPAPLSREAGPDSSTRAPVEQETDKSSMPEAQLFAVDTTGNRSLRPETLDQLPVLPRPGSEHDSDSSEEVILFKGRAPTLRSHVYSQRASPKPEDVSDSIQLREIDAEIRIVESTIEQNIGIIERTTVVESAQIVEAEVPRDAKSRRDHVALDHSEPSHLDALLDATHSDEEAALVADYMANMDDDDSEEDAEDEVNAHPGLGSHAFHMLRDLGGSDDDAVLEPDAEGDSDEDDSSDGRTASDAQTSDTQRRRVEQEDERLARILTKQEELGFGGDNLVLYDDEGEDDDGGEWQLASKVTPRSNKKKKKAATKQAKILQKKGHYPSATAMADAFDDLDLADWHRAALNNIEQAAMRASRAPQHSDSEFEEAMNMAFKKDRLKKAEKKKQREALRAQGLLGRNVNPDDLRSKYQLGMSRDELVFELEQFLIGSDEQSMAFDLRQLIHVHGPRLISEKYRLTAHGDRLRFPPLDKHARRCLHTAANHLKIKSQSSGSGDNRHPVLFRTARTLAYEEHKFESIVNRVFRRQYFTRVDVDTDVANAHRAGPRKDTSGPKRQDNAVSYREGEVVGQHARELASDNKGRMLLEKMGWAKGMALGTMDNKGIMVPIAHVMKKSRLGLGDT